jgi:hypothetical protein
MKHVSISLSISSSLNTLTAVFELSYSSKAKFNFTNQTHQSHLQNMIYLVHQAILALVAAVCYLNLILRVQFQHKDIQLLDKLYLFPLVNFLVENTVGDCIRAMFWRPVANEDMGETLEN